MFGSISAYPQNIENIDRTIILMFAEMCVLCVGIIYLNLYFLVPKLLFKNCYGKYFLSVFFIITALFWLLIWAIFSSEKLIEETGNVSMGIMEYIDGYLSFIFIYGAFWGTSTAIKLFQRWIIDKSRIYELEKNTIQSELEQLKNQITPHFLFNMLNNTNVLIHTDPETASRVIINAERFVAIQTVWQRPSGSTFGFRHPVFDELFGVGENKDRQV
jgi:sensor histidine kinase YesM